MGMMYAWATKEYLLWEMSIGQIVMYNNYGKEIQLGVQNNHISKARIKELKEIRDRMKQEEELAKSEERKKEYRAKYGDV
jgi:hypothetical protein